MKKIKAASVLLFLFAFYCKQISAQQTLIYTDPYRNYKTAMELFKNKKYSTAQQYFLMVAADKADAATEDIITYKANSEYYGAICAIELNNPDAERLMLAFVNNNPGHVLLGSAYNQLGKIYFKKKDYSKAIEWFDKVDMYDLSVEERDTYRFQYAYSLFTKKRLDEAKKLFEQLKDKQGPYYFPANYYYGFIAYFNGDYDEALKSFNRVKDENTYSLIVPYYICNIYFSQKDYNKLIAYAEPLIENTKLSYYAEINQLLGEAYFYKNNYTKALPYLKYYLDKTKTDRPEDYYQLAYTQYKTGDTGSAIESLKNVDNDNDTLMQQKNYLLANSLLLVNKKADARNALLEASEITIDKQVQENSIFNYGKLSYELQDYPAAVTSLQDYLKKYPASENKTEAQELLANALLNTKNYEQALEILKSIPDKSPKLKSAYQRVAYYSGVENYNNKKWDAAENMFVQSLQNPMDGNLQAACYFWLGEINYQRKQYDKSINNHVKFQELAKVNKNLPSETSLPFSNYTIGYDYFKNANYANAAKYFDKVASALKLSKTNSPENDIALDATLRGADSYFMTKEYKKSENNYAKIIDNNYKGADYALFQKGMLHGLEGENAQKISALQQLNSKYTTSLYVDDALYEIANTYFLMGKNTEAINGFKKLLNEKPNSNYVIKSYLKLGLIYYNEGDYATSEAYYKNAYEASPSTPEGSEAKDALKDIAQQTGNVKSVEGIISVSEKDSILYNAAKNKYDTQDFKSAVTGFNDYLKQFPKGYFREQAIFYRAESNFKQEKYDDSYADYITLIDGNKKQFLESALVRASWIAFYQKQDYKTAYTYYKKLYDVASYKENTFVAMKGILRTAYYLNDYTEVIINADRILNSEMVSDDERIEANFYKAKAFLAQDKPDKAYESFAATAQLTKNEMGVEARFSMADILFQQNKLDNSKKQALEIINNFSSYEEWVIKSYILLADIAASKGEYAQAKASLKSIIDNYKGNPDLVQLAKMKLQQVEEMERSNRRIQQSNDTITNPDELDLNNK